jgi:protein-S-isoprenylcysteine O-methyltransferase Ste14
MLNFLGKYRIALSRLFTLAISFVMIFIQPLFYGSFFYEILFFLGLIFILIGIIGRVFSSIYMSDNRHKVIVSSGVYAITRNPLYLFSFIGTVGICLIYGSLIVLALIIFAYLSYYKVIIQYEETRLSEKFGKDYIDYLNSGTPRFFPNFKLWNSPQYLTVNYGVVLKTMIDSSVFLFVALVIRVLLSLQQSSVIPTLFSIL